MSIPYYRIRIFVSVDLVGSTDFKAKKGNSFEWLKAFQMFYSNFKKDFIENYKKYCDKKKQYITDDERDELPKLWKTIGDEILFVNRLKSLCHLSCYISAFIKTLNEFGDVIKTFGLDTKGNAWVAAFPTPNCSIKSVLAHDEDPICGENGFTSENIESGADSDPRDFDFLGRNIDAGFRISRNSSVNSLTISPSLAYLLCRAKTNADPCFFPEKINFLGLEVFKGVVKNKPYPIITIDTVKNKEEQVVIQYEKKTYNKFEVDDFFEFKEYIRSYLKINELDILELKVTGRDDDLDSPQKYKNYVAKYNHEKHELEQKSNQSEKENPTEEDGSEEKLKIVQDGLNIIK